MSLLADCSFAFLFLDFHYNACAAVLQEVNTDNQKNRYVFCHGSKYVAGRSWETSMGLVVRSGRLQGGKFVILLLISAEEAANGQQHERRDREIIDQKGKRPCTGLCAGRRRVL